MGLTCMLKLFLNDIIPAGLRFLEKCRVRVDVTSWCCIGGGATMSCARFDACFAVLFCFTNCLAMFVVFITKTCLYNFDPLKPHFYTAKLGFTGVYIFFISARKHRLWVLVRIASPRQF